MQRFIMGWAIAVIAALTPALALAEGPGKAQQIANALRDSGRLKDYNINVKFQGGIARLQGQVTSPQQMGQALAIAKDVPGVERVINEMSINGAQPLTVKPAEQAPRALELASGSKRLNIEEAPEPAAEFMQHTEPVAGGPVIGGVVNSGADSPIDYAIPSRTVAAQNRVVRPMQPAELSDASSGVVPAGPSFEASPLPMPVARQTREAVDQQTAQQVANQFRAGGKLKNYRIGVTVQEGVARLNGTVASKQQMAQAVAIAKQSRGVSNVVNELTVGQPGQGAAIQKAGYDGNMGAMGGYNGYSGEVPMDGPMTGPVTGPMAGPVPGTPVPAYGYGTAGAAPAHYDEPNMPNCAWPSYAAYPNYGAVTYPRQYSPTAWPYIGPFYPYPQVPLGWRKVTLEWDDGWWFLDFDDKNW